MTGLLAVDLGLSTGLARLDDSGRLAWYRSQHFASHATLRRGAEGLLRAELGLTDLVLEGGGPIAVLWQKAGDRHGLRVRSVAAETWRARLFRASTASDRELAKPRAGVLARRFVAWSGLPRPKALRHDAAEAILLGLWAALELGWLDAPPIPLD